MMLTHDSSTYHVQHFLHHNAFDGRCREAALVPDGIQRGQVQRDGAVLDLDGHLQQVLHVRHRLLQGKQPGHAATWWCRVPMERGGERGRPDAGPAGQGFGALDGLHGDLGVGCDEEKEEWGGEQGEAAEGGHPEGERGTEG